MIKKINWFLIVVAVLITSYFILTRDDSIVLILKDASIVITIMALYIIKKLFKVKISEEINFLYILFIFIAHFLGVICELYNYIPWFDKFAHFLSGFVSSFLAIYLIAKNNAQNKVWFNIIYIVSFAMLVAVSWELFEYTASVLFKVDPQKVIKTGVNDTMQDILVAFLASVLTCLSYWYEEITDSNLIIKRFIKKTNR